MAMAFGLSIVAAAYGLGAISGAQLTPAVSLGFPAAGRMTVGDFVTYVIAQIIGAILAALVIMLIAQGHEGYSVAANGLGQNGFGPGYNGPYTLAAALLFEFVATLPESRARGPVHRARGLCGSQGDLATVGVHRSAACRRPAGGCPAWRGHHPVAAHDASLTHGAYLGRRCLRVPASEGAAGS